MSIVQHILDAAAGKHPIDARRSSHWPAVRAQHLAANPHCAACGGSEKPEVHHKRPFHLHPELELDPANLITLCESGKGGINCHLAIGHLSNYRGWNPDVGDDAATWQEKIKENKERIAAK